MGKFCILKFRWTFAVSKFQSFWKHSFHFPIFPTNPSEWLSFFLASSLSLSLARDFFQYFVFMIFKKREKKRFFSNFFSDFSFFLIKKFYFSPISWCEGSGTRFSFSSFGAEREEWKAGVQSPVVAFDHNKTKRKVAELDSRRMNSANPRREKKYLQFGIVGADFLLFFPQTFTHENLSPASSF